MENLNERTWWGLSLCSFQIRCTVVGEIPVAAASRRTLQCVVPSGGGSSVLASTRWTSSSSISRGRPERGASASPSRRRSAKLRRHSPTVGNDTPASAAICVFVAPSAARSTIRARNACCCDADGVRSTARNSRSSCSERSIAAAARAMPPTVPQLPYKYKKLTERCTSVALMSPAAPSGPL